jgi:glyoxylase-like metal-dependent hydrolase (beta-lactamase superfamily II)
VTTASDISIDFTAGAPVDGAEEPAWIHGARSAKQCVDPAIQVHRNDAHTYILRVGKAVSFEAPFLYLLFGNDRAILFDTGTSERQDRLPLRETVDSLVAAWLAEHPRPDYRLIVAHTHGHTDHRNGDPQFADRPETFLVEHDAGAVREFFGFGDGWPGQVVTFDLGGRVLELTGLPGHHPASIAVYDPWTGFLLTGDTVMPARLYAPDYPAFLDSLERLVAFAAARPVTRVLGCHIEMSRTPGKDYPAGARYQPDETPLRLPVERLAEIRDAARAADRPGVYVHDDYIIWNGGQRLGPMLGQAAKLIRFNLRKRFGGKV